MTTRQMFVVWLTASLVACATTLPPAFDEDPPKQEDTDEAPPVVEDTEPPVVDTSSLLPEDTDVDVTIEILELPSTTPVGSDDGNLIVRIRSTTHDLSSLTISLLSDLDGGLGLVSLDDTGAFIWPTTSLSAGSHTVTIAVQAPDGTVWTEDVSIAICEWPAVETFQSSATLGSDWALFGDASLDPGGWLEITGNEMGRTGAIYKTSQRVNAGNIRIAFDIATGGGIGTGADGFALNIINASDVAELTSIVNASASGGCLAYGVATPCGDLTIQGFHIEFDTWHNQNNPINDPTSDDHIAIALNGDPGNPVLWEAVGELEDLVWRSIFVQTIDERVIVSMDGVTLIDGIIPGFSFEGGFIGVSGSTGAETNYHRFDNLQVFDRCVVPE